ncbi:hypothetical protein BKA57DRAFT_448720 [Linnemannia elongata]|nr:hypothetical protein BKA57DRAFT_448720 [Linnemannia elongata]
MVPFSLSLLSLFFNRDVACSMLSVVHGFLVPLVNNKPTLWSQDPGEKDIILHQRMALMVWVCLRETPLLVFFLPSLIFFSAALPLHH